MRITYIASNVNTGSQGIGGHYYSLLATAEAIDSRHQVQIVNIGTSPSIALMKSNFEIKNIVYKNLNTLKIIRELNKFLLENPSQVIHAFDNMAYFYARSVSVMRKIPLVQTKCGGVNPKYFPACKDLINFSIENKNFFKSRNKFKKTTIHLIPNRVNSFTSDEQRIKELQEKYDLTNYDFVFLRICRVGNQYRKSMIQFINLVSKLEISGLNVCVLLIGAVVDEKVLEEIKGYNKSVKLIVERDPYFTANAKELIDVADVVLGTGRSLMEAALKNKLVLTPLKDEPIPILVTQANFQQLASTNFSERGNVDGFELEKEVSILKEILSSKEKQMAFTEKMNFIFNENFNIEQKLDLYEKIYTEAEYKFGFNVVDTFLNYLFIQRRFMLSKRKNKKVVQK